MRHYLADMLVRLIVNLANCVERLAGMTEEIQIVLPHSCEVCQPDELAAKRDAKLYPITWDR